MQAVERAFQEFKRRHGHHLARAVAMYRAEAPSFGEDPGRVALSHRGALGYFAARVTQAAPLATIRSAFTLQAWAAYHPAKQIYTLEEPLAAALQEARWPEGLPTSALFLPVNGAVLRLRLAGDDERSDFIVFYDEAPGGGSLLRVARVTAAGAVLPGALLPLLGAPLQQTLDEGRADDEAYLRATLDRSSDAALSRYLARELPRYDAETSARARVLRHLLNALLYVNGNDDLVRTLHPGAKPRRAGRRGGRDDADFSPTVIQVGKRFVSSLEHWEVARSTEGDARASFAGVRPHLRRAHLHLYWTGPGRTLAKFVTVRPSLVRGGREGEEPALRKVR